MTANILQTERTVRLETLIANVFMAIVSIMVVALLWRDTLDVAPSYNEGWNAYHATQVFKGLALYPSHGSMIGNNYPPISFFLTAAVMHLIPDGIFAGRLVSSVAFLMVTGLIGLIGFRRGGDVGAAMFGAAVFAGCMAAVYPAAVGLYDPQMLAYAVLLAGVWLLTGDRLTVQAIFGAALLMTCSLFIKHNIVSMVAATGIWLLVYDTRRGLLFAAFGLILTALAFALCYAAYGPDFVAALLAPRVYLPAKGLHDLLTLPTAVKGLAVLASLIVLGWRTDRWAALLGLCLLSALVFGTIQAVGSGVGENAYFEVVIASALCIGHLLARLRRAEGLPQQGAVRCWLMVACAVACFWGNGLVLAKDAALVMPWRAAQLRSEQEVNAVVGRVAALPGRALCQTSLYCYWAGKTFEFDNFRFIQDVQFDQRVDQRLINQIDNRVYSSIVLNAPESDFVMTQTALDAIHRNYVVDFANARQIIYARRVN